MTRRQALRGSIALTSAIIAEPAFAETDEDKALRLHLAILVLTLNNTFRTTFLNVDPTTLPDGNLLKTIYNKWPTLYNTIQTNAKNDSTFNASAKAFQNVFVKTGIGLLATITTSNLYPDPNLCPCSFSMGAHCPHVLRLLQ